MRRQPTDLEKVWNTLIFLFLELGLLWSCKVFQLLAADINTVFMSVKEKATDLKNKFFKPCKGVTKLWMNRPWNLRKLRNPYFFWKRKEGNEIKKKKDINTVRKFVFWFKEDCFQRRICFICPRRPTLIVGHSSCEGNAVRSNQQSPTRSVNNWTIICKL